MADVFVDENTLRGIANAIRSKNGSSATYFPAEMEQAIRDLQIPDVSALNATAADILYPKKAFTADGETEGTIQTKSASDVTVSGDTVSAPAGYYPNAVSKSVQSGSAATPATTISANPTISVNNSTGLVTASVNETQAITPTVSEGYVSAGTPGNVSASGSATSQLPTQSAATITPSQSQQTAVAAGKFTTGAVVVDPIPSEYIVPTGTKQISITQNGTTTEDVSAYASAEITVNVSGGGGGTVNKIASGTYTGDGGNVCTVPVGKKMPNTNFVFRMYAPGGTEFTYDSKYKFSELTCVITDTMVSYDLSSDGTKSPVYTGNITWAVNNSGTITSVTQYSTGYLKYVRNATTGLGNQGQSGRPSIIRDASGFSLYYSQGNANYAFVSGLTYYWALYYCGNNPTNEIVEVT